VGTVRNILFIMCDQLRWDYLSCYGHPTLQTPHIDKLAAKGIRFDRAYVQSPVCGPSRASYYTGRTVFSHGSTWNGVPLPIGEMTMGDYLRPHGYRTAVVGKTHMVPDRDGMARFGLNPGTEIGVIVSEPGFEPYERDDGLHPNELLRLKKYDLRYNDWLRAQGYQSENPWNDFANSAEGPNGELLSAWNLRYSNLPARVKEEHSETAYMTDRAMTFIRESGETPWLLHLSFIKPHWPYIAPAPYHALYGPNQFIPVHRSERERQNANPVYAAFMQHDVAQAFSRDEVRSCVLAGYMGLVKQIDDHMGRLFAFLEETGRARDTMIVFTSDHGDYLGDHWMGEKELFHEQSARVPMIIYDPSPEADATRGTVSTRFIEALDMLPTFLDVIDPAWPRSRQLARRGVQRNRLRLLPGAADPRCRRLRGARLYDPHRPLEVRLLQALPAAAVRPRRGPGRVRRSRYVAGPRRRPRRNEGTAVRAPPGAAQPCCDVGCRGASAALRRNQDRDHHRAVVGAALAAASPSPQGPQGGEERVVLLARPCLK